MNTNIGYYDQSMKIPCASLLPFLISGLSFLQPELTNIQFQNLVSIATALILGAKFNLSEISRMWLKNKSVSALSEFLSDAKFSTLQMQHLYWLQVLNLYKITNDYFIIDETIKQGLVLSSATLAPPHPIPLPPGEMASSFWSYPTRGKGAQWLG